LTKVAFWIDFPVEYTGGINYIKNLLYAVSLVNDGQLEPYVFLGAHMSERDMAEFGRYATVVQTPLLRRKGLWWAFNRMLVKTMGWQILVKRELMRRSIHIISHASCVSGLGAPCKVISWVPDFQFLHLPEFFPGLDVTAEKNRLRKFISLADAVVLSSRHAYEDFCAIAPACASRARVLRFVSQPDTRLNAVDDRKSMKAVEEKYGFSGRFFYLPNQFWKHKNHEVAFTAVAELKKRGIETLLICTGNLQDYRTRGPAHVETLRRFVAERSLQRNIMILGMIPYEDVLFLMRNCAAVINPSRFEGWSSTVEESKSIGKLVLLSDIPVHREQDPPRGMYFDPDDAAALSNIMEEVWKRGDEQDADLRSEARAAVRERTVAYGRAYIDLIQSLSAKSA
jgi:glycosyltransferase involved in cell wall biosynthesis